MKKHMVSVRMTICHFGKRVKGDSSQSDVEAAAQQKKKDGKMKEQPTMLMKTKERDIRHTVSRTSNLGQNGGRAATPSAWLGASVSASGL